MPIETPPLRILAIDDDPATIEYLSLFLGSRGYQVFQTNEGSEGVRLAGELQPDVIVVDIKMPGMSGVDVCTKVRQISSVPILVLSALDEPGEIANALDAGADDYMTKPVTGKLLVARLQTLQRRAGYRGQNMVAQQTATAG